MEITYDKEANAMYIRFKREKVEDTKTDRNEIIHIDYASDGSVIGIEVLNVSEHVSSPIPPDYRQL